VASRHLHRTPCALTHTKKTCTDPQCGRPGLAAHRRQDGSGAARSGKYVDSRSHPIRAPGHASYRFETGTSARMRREQKAEAKHQLQLSIVFNKRTANLCALVECLRIERPPECDVIHRDRSAAMPPWHSHRLNPSRTFKPGDPMASAGRKWTGCFGVRSGNKRTFVHGDCQRQLSTQTGHRCPPFWIARKPEAYLFSTEACSIALSRELPPLPAQECMTTLYPR